MMAHDRHVCILGMGFVGLTLAVVMVECGFQVIGVEIDPNTVKRLESGDAHFFEVGLQARLRRALAGGALRFVSGLTTEDVSHCSLFILTVGTPLDQSGAPRMDMVERATRQVTAVMPEGALVVLRSTVRLGTTRAVVKPILDATGKRYQLAYCPERTIEGNALAELRMLPQIVGGLVPEDAWRAAAVFQHMTPTTLRVSSLETAEAIKLLDNSYRDLFFAFGNEVALLCEAAGLDAVEVIGAGKMGYQRTSIAAPGFVGGPCLEKDPHILEHSMKDFRFVPELISIGRRLNERVPDWVARSLAELLGDRREPLKIAICGLAFKGRPETDDVRGTPATLLTAAMRATFPGAELVGQDFAVASKVIRDQLGLTPVSIDDAFAGASAVVIANNNARYEWIDLDRLMERMARPAVLYDCWSVLQLRPADAPEGVRYVRFGSVAASLARGEGRGA